MAQVHSFLLLAIYSKPYLPPNHLFYATIAVGRRGLWATGKELARRARVGKANLNTEEEVLRQILGHKRERLRQLGGLFRAFYTASVGLPEQR